MASTTSTSADSTAPRSDEVVKALVDLYEREHVMYGEVRMLAQKQLEAVRAGDSLTAIHDLLTRKRTMLDMIRHMETNHEQAKRYWERHRHELTGAMPGRLQESLRRLSVLIEEILDLENESDRMFIAMAGA